MLIDSRFVRKHARVGLVIFWLVVNGIRVSSLDAQDQPAGIQPADKIERPTSIPPRARQAQHRFWDSTNAALFAGVGGARALDYTSTQHFRNKGVNEILLTNNIVDNKPLFAAIEVAGVATSIGISYLFHRTGHHKLERWVSIVHFSVGTSGAVRNYFLEPNNPASLRR